MVNQVLKATNALKLCVLFGDNRPPNQKLLGIQVPYKIKYVYVYIG